MTTWKCAVIRNTANRPMALVVSVTGSAYSSAAEGNAVQRLFGNTSPFQGLKVVLAHEVGNRLELKGDPGLVSQLSRQAWNLWDWRDITIS